MIGIVSYISALEFLISHRSCLMKAKCASLAEHGSFEYEKTYVECALVGRTRAAVAASLKNRIGRSRVGGDKASRGEEGHDDGGGELHLES